MTTEQVIKYYGSKVAIAKALEINPQALTNWGDQPPPLRQLQLEKITRGKLRADKACQTG